MLMIIVEEAKEHWGRANHGTSLYRIISETWLSWSFDYGGLKSFDQIGALFDHILYSNF